MKYGVPQGSVAGPVIFLSYLSSLYDMIVSYIPEYAGYADDHQLYLAFSANDDDTMKAITDMSACIKDVRIWLLNHNLMNNDDKTEFMILGSRKQLSKLNISEIIVGSET